MNYTRYFECGCRVVVIGELTNAKIQYCPKHRASPEMYEALKAMPKYASEIGEYALDLVLKAINKAEGK